MRGDTATDDAHLLAAAREAVRLAGLVCRTLQPAVAHAWARRHADPTAGEGLFLIKADRSPVTIGDYAAQAIIAATLSERCGPMPILAEESAATLRDPANRRFLNAVVHAVRSVRPGMDEAATVAAVGLGRHETPEPPGPFWTLDPIDGTKGFLRGQQYAVCLALIDPAPAGGGPGRAAIAAMACPNLSSRFDAPVDAPDPEGTLYAAGRGRGTREWPLTIAAPAGEGLTISRGPRDGDRAVLCASVEPGRQGEGPRHAVLGAAGLTWTTLSLDSQAKYAVVARGQGDVVLRLPRRPGHAENIWDHAPGALIAAEAGCAVTGLSGEPLDFGAGPTLARNAGILCAAPLLHGRLVRAVAGPIPGPAHAG